MACSLSRSLLTEVSKFSFHIKHNVSLARLSTFAIGGIAKNYLPVENNDDLISILKLLHKKSLPFKVFAGGSNIVFPDNGLELFLIHLKNGNFHLQNNSIIADAGVPLSQIINLSIENGLSGLENLSGIPGSLGGAIVGNAGAYGSSVSDPIIKVKIWHKGKIGWLDKIDCKFLYRDSIFKHKPLILLEIELELSVSEKSKLQKISAEIINIRTQKYKPGLKCPGSFFKNVLVTAISPQKLTGINQSVIIAGKIPAGYLLTEVGARGLSVGGIEVSDFHGNLLINNKGNGKASDVKKLAEILKNKVYKKFGIMLEEEVRYI